VESSRTIAMTVAMAANKDNIIKYPSDNRIGCILV